MVSPSPSSVATSDLPSFLLQSRKFTHLIVGGGTAGLALAARLSEHTELNVGVLEAGPAAWNDPGINVPGKFGETLEGELDWQFETVPQEQLGEKTKEEANGGRLQMDVERGIRKGRSLKWPRGKVLGGSSALNFMTWNRGCKGDYDAWATLLGERITDEGEESWCWKGINPFFLKSERFYPPTQQHTSLYASNHTLSSHGTSGPLATSYSSQYAASHALWHATLDKLGISTNDNHLGGSNLGAWTSLVSVEPEAQERSYSATAYLRPVAHRANLHVLTEAVVQEVVIEKDCGGEWVAKGVKFMHTRGIGEIDEVHVIEVVEGGEVVLCGGSVASPQLLELSGIGNPDILAAAKVDVKVANGEVGEHLQEHMSMIFYIFFSSLCVLSYSKSGLQDLRVVTAMVFEIDPSIPTLEDLRSDPALKKEAEEQYAENRTGLLTTLPSSVLYLPFNFIVPCGKLEKLASCLPSPKTLRERILYERFIDGIGDGASNGATASVDGSENHVDSPDKCAEERTRKDRWGLGQIEYNFDLSNYNPLFQPATSASSSGLQEKKKYATMMMMLQYPFSVGSIHIPPFSSSSFSSQTTKEERGEATVQENKQERLTNGEERSEEIIHQVKQGRTTAQQKPIIDPRYFAGPGGDVDLQTMIEGVRFADKICKTEPLKRMVVKRVFPEEQEGEEDGDEYWEDWIRRTLMTDWHPVGTCGMMARAAGGDAEEEGVVDGRLRVYGVKGLRVCDASVMPLQISAHLQATVYAIAEKGAVIMWEDWVARRYQGEIVENGKE
ncbi:MAG: hypothetical protein Q9167_005957 [Letrouitia subvulpina]